MIQFVEVDAKKIYDDIIIQVQKALQTVLYPGDERRIFLEQQAQIIVAIYNAINETGKKNLLRYAKGEVLDAIGEENDTYRLPAQKSKAALKFILSAAQPNNIIIPKGTRATPDGVLFFATKKDSMVNAGATNIEIEVEATETGEEYNNFAVGQINQLVDPIPFVSSVTNTTISSGGANIEPDDDGVNVWSGYRERIRLSSAKQSTAGSEYGYIYWAKTADSNIQDVAVTSPNDGEILITILMKNRDLPTQSILEKVLSVCSDKKVRPMTDKVTVSGPTQVTYNINFNYYIDKNNLGEELNIRNKIEGINGAVETYKLWQDSKMGRDINPDYLRQLVLNAGASRIDVVNPIFTQITDIEVPKIGTVSINYGGLI